MKTEQAAMNEINSLKKLDHPNIIQLHEYYMDVNFIYLILERIDGLELKDYIAQTNIEFQKNLRIIFKQLILAVEHCHSHGIIHRNITPDNILIIKRGEKFFLKLIDFSQVFFLSKNQI